MAATSSQIVLDTLPPDFRLLATDGRTYGLDDVAGENGSVIVFICNHCPYVKGVIDRLVADARILLQEDIGFACICSNDAESYPDDSFDKMKEFAQAHDFPFPYLHDETQSVARSYGAVCTPDFFGYDRERRLKYRGRLDEGRTTPLRLARGATSSRRCAPSPPREWRRQIKFRRSVVQSNGGCREARRLADRLMRAAVRGRSNVGERAIS